MIDHDEPAEALRQVRSHVKAPSRAGLGAILFGMTIGRLFRFRRRRGRTLRLFGLGLLIAVLSVTTCSFGVDPASLTTSYGPPIPASAEAATRMVAKSAAAMRGMTSGNVLRLTVTESEVTSALSLGMMMPELMRTVDGIPPEELPSGTDLESLRERVWQEERATREAMLEGLTLSQRILMKLDPRLRTGDVQVRFEESGEVVVAGFIQAWSFRQTAMFVVAPSATSGQLELDFVRGRLGRLPAPEFAFDLLGDLIVSVILLGQDYAEISELSVGDGTLTFVGRLHK